MHVPRHDDVGHIFVKCANLHSLLFSHYIMINALILLYASIHQRLKLNVVFYYQIFIPTLMFLFYLFLDHIQRYLHRRDVQHNAYTATNFQKGM